MGQGRQRYRHAGGVIVVAALAASGLTLPGVRGKLTSEGPEIGGNSPQELTTFLERGIARWAQVIKDSGVKL